MDYLNIEKNPSLATHKKINQHYQHNPNVIKKTLFYAYKRQYFFGVLIFYRSNKQFKSPTFQHEIMFRGEIINKIEKIRASK